MGYIRFSAIFSIPRCRKPMSQSTSTTVSPSSFNTTRNTPWVEGCCGPMLSVISGLSSSVSLVVAIST